MNRRITLLNYTFIFTSFKSEEGQRLCQLEYFDNAQHNSVHVSIKREDIENDVLPFKADFNAEYALEELPEDVWDKLHESKLLSMFKDWLRTNYQQLALMEVINNAEENNQFKH